MSDGNTCLPTPAERLAQALAEMRLIREGKLPAKTWREIKNEEESQ